jgi:hypothetical protein
MSARERSAFGSGNREKGPVVAVSVTPVQFTRLPITSPCPVPVEAGTGRTFDDANEPLAMEDRTELCAVDAEWMIGAQRICSHHLRELFALGFFVEDSYEDLVREVYNGDENPYFEHVMETHSKPWGDRHRYSQEDARSWADSAKEHSLA